MQFFLFYEIPLNAKDYKPFHKQPTSQENNFKITS
jgi:hypothetical protein